MTTNANVTQKAARRKLNLLELAQELQIQTYRKH